MALSDGVDRIRFAGERDAARGIAADPQLSAMIDAVGHDPGSPSARKELLASAIRIDGDLLPDVHRTVDGIRERSGLREALEFFVYQSPVIEAAALKAPRRFFVLLSSASIEKLDTAELSFVVGHEISHVIFDHFKIPTRKLIHSELEIEPRQSLRLLSWQRRAEISADRVGLLCCGSLEVAASAFFKTLSGLSIEGLRVKPETLSRQFDQLRDELWEVGAEDMWAMTHPLVPLRMKSLDVFWSSELASELIAEAPGGRSNQESDREISRLLSYMDPGSQRGDDDVDPLLVPFLLWGGLYLAASNDVIEASELRALESLVGKRNLEDALKGPRKTAHYRERFLEAREKRRNPLSALDLNRTFTGLITVVRADGAVDEKEIEALGDLARELGIAESYVESLLEEL